MTAGVQINVTLMRAQLQPIVAAGEDGITEELGESIGNGLEQILGGLYGLDRLAAVAAAISPRSPELEAIARASGLTDSARHHVDMSLSLLTMGLDRRTRQAVFAATLLEMLPEEPG